MKKIIYKDNIFLDQEGNIYNIFEVLYLFENKQIEIYDENNRKIENIDDILDKNIKTYYIVFKYLKNKDIKFGTALKFGSLFRIYKNPFDEHSRWLCYPINYNEKILMYDFIAKNRVSHSTRKTLLLAIIKDNNIIYLESKWKKL